MGREDEKEPRLTPVPQQLDNKTLNRLETAVAKSSYVGQGKKLKVTNRVRLPTSLTPPHPPFPTTGLSLANPLPHKVDPEIVGGLVVEIGDRTIDLSVSSKVARMNKLLQDTL